MPKLFEQKRYLFYAFSVIALCFLGATFFEFLFSYDLPVEELVQFGEGGEFPPLYSFESLSFSALPLFGAWTISMLYRVLQINKIREQEKTLFIEAESQFLKSQMNPHFLFNALNNIYSMSIVEPKKTSNSIYQLSELLRYVVYDSSKTTVPLSKEVKYLKNFIELHQLKNQNNKNIETSFQIENEALQIAPMLLLPFIENAFKHSNVEDTNNGFIKIDLSSRTNIVYFKIRNSIPKTPMAKDQQGGIGLKNIQKRLKLFYNNRYQLNIKTQNNTFEVFLKLELL